MSFLEALRAQFANQFFTGGLVLVVFTALLALMRRIPYQLWTLLERQFITTIDIADHDPAFFWIQKWLGMQSYTQSKARLLTVTTRTMPVGANKSIEESSTHLNHKRQLTEVIFSPAPGSHLLRFHGHLILLTRTRKENEGTMGEVAYHETMTFRTFSRETIKELIYTAREVAFPPEDNRVAVLRPAYSGWRLVQRRLPRAMDSVILDGNLAEDLLMDLRWFFGASEWYATKGIPYQRGYLFHGPSGAGKTSIVVALASLFGRDIYIVNLTSVTDASLSSLMADLPEHAIVLMEDVDTIFHKREKTSDSNDYLSFSGFLNAIDGVTAPPGRILFMTTNHLDKIDEALIRPGRADRKFYFGYATADMARRLYLRFFPDQMGEDFEQKFTQRPGVMSMADLQEHFIKHRQDAKAAVEKL